MYCLRGVINGDDKRHPSELDMGPFLLTQFNPIHQLMDPIQSNPKIAGIKANSYIKAYVPLSIVMTINRGYSAVDKCL